MVTMRRDVAVNKNVSADAGMTPYDRFMMKKNARRTVETAVPSVSKPFGFGAYGNNNNFDAVATKKDECVAKDTQTEYDLYLLNELNNPMRTMPLMSEAEFYQKNMTKPMAKSASKRAPREKAEARPGQLSKLGKIILSAYVLVAMLTAFTLIAVNVFKEPVLADAFENVTTGERVIRPMTIEKLDQEESNWFDQLCDAVKK